MASSAASMEATTPLTNGKNATASRYNTRGQKSGNQISRDNENNNSLSRNDDNITARDNVNWTSTFGDIDDDNDDNDNNDNNDSNNNSIGVEMEESLGRTRSSRASQSKEKLRSRASQPKYQEVDSDDDDNGGGDDDEEDYNSGSDDDNSDGKQPPSKNNNRKSKNKVSKNKTNDDNKHDVMKNVRVVMVSSDIIWDQPKIKASGPVEEEHFGDFEDKETMAEKSQKAHVAKYGGRDIKHYEGQQQPRIQQMLERCATSTTMHHNIKPFDGELKPGDPFRSETLTVLPLELYDPEHNEFSAFCTNCLRAVDCTKGDQIAGDYADDHVAMCNPTKLPLDANGRCPCNKGVNDKEFKDNTAGFYLHAKYCFSTRTTANSDHQPNVQAAIRSCIDDNARCPSVLPFNGACAPGADVRSETITTVPRSMYVDSEHSGSAFCTHCKSILKKVIRNGAQKKKVVEKHVSVCNPRDLPIVDGMCPCNKSLSDFSDSGQRALFMFIKHCKEEHPTIFLEESDEEENEESEEEGDESEGWSLVAVSKAREILSNMATKCDGINGGQCNAIACCKWVLVDDGVAVDGVAPWFGCLECQKKEFDGWPKDEDYIPIDSLEDDDRVAMLDKCVPPSFSYRKRARELPFTTEEEAEAASKCIASKRLRDIKRRRKK